MGIGIGVFVVALGAVLAFAVDWSIGGLDLKDVGWTLMIAGVVGLILLSALWRRRLAAETATSVRQRQVINTPPTHDDPTQPPPATTTTAVAPEPATPMAPQPTARAKVITVPMAPQPTARAKVITVRAGAPVASSPSKDGHKNGHKTS